MKKSLITLLVLSLLFGAFLMSCSSDVDSPAAYSTELVDVTFDEGSNSKSLTATLETFIKGDYYWKYAAKKADDSGLSSGATATYDEAGALPVSAGNKGLADTTGAYKVSGFSQGLWDFTLYAYRNKNTSGAYEDLIYTGEVKNVSLTKGGSNSVQVLVSPISTGNGIIKIGTISFVPKKSGDSTSHTKVIEVTNPDGSAVSGITYDSENKQYSVPAGAYKVTVKFTNSANTIVYGEGYVIATVYPSLITTVAGSLNELVTYAQFDAELNPDAVNAKAESTAVAYDASEDVTLTSVSETKTVTTKVAKEDVKSIIETMAAEQAVPTDSSTTSLKLALNVDPTEATQTTVTYEIGMTATLTYQETSTSAKQVSEKPVIDLSKYIVVEIQMSTGLSSVSVTHSGHAMVECNSLEILNGKTASDDTTDKAGFFYYDPAGKLYLKTIKLSPFAISYTAPAAYVADVDGVKYGTLKDAVAQVKDGTSTVTLLTDIALTSTQETTKSFTLNLNGFSIAAENCRAIHVKEGTLTLKGTGTIAAGKADSTFGASSSVIRVGDSEGTAAGLVIGKDVTISSSYCYGVSIFGTETNGQTLDVNGKIKVTGTASAISGNGSDYLTATTITINEGAEVYAENDYAIYHPQRGTLTVEDGTIEGKGGIEAKGGNVIVKGGAITATAPKQSHEEYNNGASTSGYALAAVKNPNYPGEGSIRVNDGMITGKLILATDEAASFTTKLEVSGGMFTLDPKDYVISGCESIKDESTGLYIVREKPEVLIQKAGIPDETMSLISFAKSVNSGKTYSGYTVTLICDVILDGNTWEWIGYNKYAPLPGYTSSSRTFYGEFNGANHTITLPDNSFLFGDVKNVVIKNLNVVMNGDSNMVFWIEGVSLIENVIVSGKIEYAGSNNGVFVVYDFSEDLTLKDCTNNADVTITGPANAYDAIFVGYTAAGSSSTNYKKISYVNCVNEGIVSGAKIAMFLGNPNTYYINMIVEDCKNNGTITSFNTNTEEYNFNLYVAHGSNCYMDFIVNGYSYGGLAETNLSKLPSAPDDKTIVNNGSIFLGPIDSSFKLVQNDDKSFTIIPPTNLEDVDYYVVSVGTYIGMTDGGSSRTYATQKIMADSSSLKTDVKDLWFVDQEWVKNNPSAVKTEVGNNIVYSLNNEQFYLIKEAESGKYTLNGQPRESQMINVVAYSSSGRAISSVSYKE